MEISSVSAFAALVQKGLRLDFGQYAQIKAPGRIVDANDGGTWVAENAPITIRAQRITSGALLQPRKLILITAFSSEIIAQSNIEAVSRAIISEGLALKLDATAFDANPGDSSRPQGLLYGVAGLTPTAGGGLNALVADLRQLMAALVAAGAGRGPTIVAHPEQALTLALLAGPRFDIPVLRSSAVPAGTVIMIEASSLATAWSNVPQFEVGAHPLLTFDDTSPPSDPMTGQPSKSMFQTDSIGLRARLTCSWGLRAPHISWLTGATW
jgi:Phage capsid family